MQYQLVDKAPKELKKNELVLFKPDFIEQIAKSKLRRGTKKLTTANALRDALMLITDIYDNTVNPYRINLSAYEGIAYETDQDLSVIIMKILDDQGVDLVTKALDKQLRERNSDITSIFYVSDDLTGAATFIANGFTLKK